MPAEKMLATDDCPAVFLSLVNRKMAGDISGLSEICKLLLSNAQSLNKNDLTRVEATLITQATVLCHTETLGRVVHVPRSE